MAEDYVKKSGTTSPVTLSRSSVEGVVLKQPRSTQADHKRDERTGQFLSAKTQTALFSYRNVISGIPSKAAKDAERMGLTRSDIRMIIPDRTLDRRIAEDAPLKPDEADGLARLIRVLEMAQRVFENDAVAGEWLHSANPALDGQVPMEMARTDLGGREVEAVLGRIAHGVFS